MAKKRKALRVSSPGLLRQLQRAAKRAAKAFDRSTDFMAARRGKTIRRASTEWMDKERLPTRPVTARWAHQKEGDKQRWYANFEGVVVTFVIWPEDNLDKVEQAAREEICRLYGVFAETWTLHELRLLGTLAEEQAAEDAKA